MNKKENIIVVGGYGHVGRTICTELGEKYPGKVYAAGRNRERAEAFSQETDGKVKPLRLDIHEPVQPEWLQEARLVIMCMDQVSTDFVRACFQSGTHYIDITANGEFLEQVENFGEEAYAHGATAVLSVGLAPGLTNLLAHHAHKLLDRTDEIHTSIMLGLGDSHGQAAIEWTLDHMNARFVVTQNGRNVAVNSFAEGMRTDFGADVGWKTAYRFPFSDQQTVSRTLLVPTVSTRLCFDSALVTALLAGFRAIGLFRLLQKKWVRKATVRMLSRLPLGSDRFAIKVDARGVKNNEDARVGCMIHGKNQSEMTAKVAAFVADAVYREPFPYGVSHIEQLFSLLDMQKWIEKDAAIEFLLNGKRSI